MANLAQSDYDDTHPVPTGVGIASQLVNPVRNGKTIRAYSVFRGQAAGATACTSPTTNLFTTYVDGTRETLIFDGNTDLYALGLTSWAGG